MANRSALIVDAESTIAGGRQLRYRGGDRNRAWFEMTAAVDNLLRITALGAQAF